MSKKISKTATAARKKGIRDQPLRKCKKKSRYQFSDYAVVYDPTFNNYIKVGAIAKILKPTIVQKENPFIVLMGFDKDFQGVSIFEDWVYEIPAYKVMHLSIDKFKSKGEIAKDPHFDNGNMAIKDFQVVLDKDDHELVNTIYLLNFNAILLLKYTLYMYISY